MGPILVVLYLYRTELQLGKLHELVAMMVSPVPMAAPIAVATPGVMMAGAAPGYYRTENVGTVHYS